MVNKVIFDIEKLNMLCLFPIAFLILFGVFLLIIGMIKKDLTSKFYLSLTSLALVFDLGFILTFNGDLRGFFNLILLDGVAILSATIIILTSLFFLLFSFARNEFEEYQKSEFYTLFLFMISGFNTMIMSDNLILIILGLELSSLCLYTLIALKNTTKSVEAAIKYFVMGALGSAFFVFGAGLLYLSLGSVELYEMNYSLKNLESNSLLIISSIFIITGLGFKVSLVPFHTWLSDIYNASNEILAGFISIVPKLAAFIVVLRVFDLLLGIESVKSILFILAIITMSFANIVALSSKNIKKMLTFSSISHAGFILGAIFINSTDANVGLFLYWIMFSFANLGAFGILWSIKNGHYDYESFKGLAKSNLGISLLMSLFMLSLAGIPPFSLFWGKFYILNAALSKGYVILAIVMALNSAIALFYYLKLVINMFLYDEKSKISFEENGFIKFSLILCAAFCLLAPFVVKLILAFLYNATIFSGF